MNDKIILRNPNKFDVGIITPDKPNGINIRPGSFALVTQYELDYLNSICDLLTTGVLRVDDQNKEAMEKLGIDQENDPHFIKDEEIRKRLGGTAKKVREWLATIEEDHILDRICDVAKTMNLSVDKIKILQERAPHRDFLND